MENPVKRIPRYQISLVREKSMTLEFPDRISNADRAAILFRELFRDLDRENLAVLTLDSKNRIIGVNLVSVGSLSSSVAHPREMVKLAVLQNAAAIIHGHNHPSGDPGPSREDTDLHKRLLSACEVIGIRLLDGIVTGESKYYSFSDEQEHYYASSGL
jgi:DNA repair protein RadC